MLLMNFTYQECYVGECPKWNGNSWNPYKYMYQWLMVFEVCQVTLTVYSINMHHACGSVT